jgi:hypothetical protein
MLLCPEEKERENNERKEERQGELNRTADR